MLETATLADGRTLGDSNPPGGVFERRGNERGGSCKLLPRVVRVCRWCAGGLAYLVSLVLLSAALVPLASQAAAGKRRPTSPAPGVSIQAVRKDRRRIRNCCRRRPLRWC